MTIRKIAIVGGGIAGLSCALHLHAQGIACDVYEAVAEIKELGVGITLLPHAMRELTALGLQAEICEAGIENYESAFYNRYGQFIYKELRGKHAGYALPEIGIHRGRLHRILYDAAVQRLGVQHIHLNHRFGALTQNEQGVSLRFEGIDKPVHAQVAIAADGIHSALRKLYYPDEKLAFTGINTWRGVTKRKPILTGKTYLRVGSIATGKMVIYPIIDKVDDEGNQLINWMAEIARDANAQNDWNQKGKIEDFIDIYKDWTFDWLDVPALIRDSKMILEYPMVDKDPIAQWTFGRVTFMGDAAHPMYPRGSNGSAQAMIDGRTFANEAAKCADDFLPALHAYETTRRPATEKVVLTNRSTPPDFINTKVDELSGGKPFRHIDDVISQEALRAISDSYKQVAGFALGQVK